MKISEFCKYLERLDSTSKRLEITAILKELLQNLDPKDDEVAKAVYLSLGYLKAAYANPKFNIAEKMMIRVLENAYGLSKSDIEKVYAATGDLGDAAYKLAKEPQIKNQQTVCEIHSELVKLAEIEGTGSQEEKVKKLTGIILKVDKLSAKYLIRIVLGTTRLGFTELTIIDALNSLINGTKETEAQIELTYNLHPDIGVIASKLKAEGLKGIKKIGIETGVPIMPQRCQRLSDTNEIIEKMGTVFAEFKFDGTRVQLHMDRKKEDTSTKEEQNQLFNGSKEKILIKTYTRNLEETTHQYPDIVEAAEEQIDAKSVILDGEAIGYNKETGDFLPFQKIMQRKRKHDVAETAKNVPLKYFVFDILYLDGKSLVDLPFTERRDILSKVIKPGIVIEVDSNIKTADAEELNDYFELSKEKGLEGVVVKKVDAKYQAGARAYTWIKLKRADTQLLDDSVDCVVLGYYLGKGIRTEFGIGGFLAGVYDSKTQTYKTITKVGTGLKEADFARLKAEADSQKIASQPNNVEISKNFYPNVWVNPKIVVELGADEISKSSTHTAGYALRFPRLIKFRTDKKPQDTTSLEEIEDIYKAQKRGSY